MSCSMAAVSAVPGVVAESVDVQRPVSHRATETERRRVDLAAPRMAAPLGEVVAPVRGVARRGGCRQYRRGHFCRRTGAVETQRPTHLPARRKHRCAKGRDVKVRIAAVQYHLRHIQDWAGFESQVDFVLDAAVVRAWVLSSAAPGTRERTEGAGARVAGERAVRSVARAVPKGRYRG